MSPFLTSIYLIVGIALVTVIILPHIDILYKYSYNLHLHYLDFYKYNIEEIYDFK